MKIHAVITSTFDGDELLISADVGEGSTLLENNQSFRIKCYTNPKRAMGIIIYGAVCGVQGDEGE